VAVGAAAFAYRGKNPSASGASATAQDVAGLDRKISSLEQRLYFIESRINRLEQQSALPPRAAAPSASGLDVEVSSIRGEIETLRRRMGDVECGLLKLDERTAKSAAREARERAGAGLSDPCRLDAESPVKLSARP
jgi:hypothetical protein